LHAGGIAGERVVHELCQRGVRGLCKHRRDMYVCFGRKHFHGPPILKEDI
jgi:hypothetical protein